MFSKFLLKLNSFFGLDVKKILKKASYLIGSQAVSNGLSFLLALGAAHFISKETYGTYRYILSTVSFIGALSLTGLSTAIIRNSAKGFDNLFKNSIKRSIVWSIPAIVIGVCAGGWYFLNGNNLLGFSITFGGILFPVFQSLLLYRSYLNGKENFKLLMSSNIFYSAITSLTLLATMFYSPSVLSLILAYYISNILATLIINIFVRKKYPPNNLTDPDAKKLEHHLSLMNILDTGATQLDKVIIFQIAGPVEVAKYIFATIIPEQLRNVVKYTSTLSMPIFSNLPYSTAKSKGIFLIKRLFLITIPIVILYFFIAPFLYKIFFPTYLESIWYSQLFALILLFDGGISGTILKAKNEIKKLYFVNIISNVSKIILLFTLGITMGITGIIISRIISRIIGFFIAFILLKKVKTNESI